MATDQFKWATYRFKWSNWDLARYQEARRTAANQLRRKAADLILQAETIDDELNEVSAMLVEVPETNEEQQP